MLCRCLLVYASSSSLLPFAVGMATRLITLSGGGPWGFTLAGGRDFGSPLKVAKVCVRVCVCVCVCVCVAKVCLCMCMCACIYVYVYVHVPGTYSMCELFSYVRFVWLDFWCAFVM